MSSTLSVPVSNYADTVQETQVAHNRLAAKIKSLECRIDDLQEMLFRYQHTRQKASIQMERMAKAEYEGQLLLQQFLAKQNIDK